MRVTLPQPMMPTLILVGSVPVDIIIPGTCEWRHFFGLLVRQSFYCIGCGLTRDVLGRVSLYAPILYALCDLPTGNRAHTNDVGTVVVECFHLGLSKSLRCMYPPVPNVRVNDDH
jgi:hypothetical protein